MHVVKVVDAVFFGQLILKLAGYVSNYVGRKKCFYSLTIPSKKLVKLALKFM